MLAANLKAMPKRPRPPKLDHTTLVERVRAAVDSGQYRILPHARLRCTAREVAAADIEHALLKGHAVPKRDRYDEPYESWSYCFEGLTVDEVHLRVVVSFDDWMLVVTVVNLDMKD